MEAVDSEGRIVFGNLPGLHLRQGSDRIEAGILGQGQRNGLEGVGETAEGVLLDGLDL